MENKNIEDRLDKIDNNLKNHMAQTLIVRQIVDHNEKMQDEQIELIRDKQSIHFNKIVTRLAVIMVTLTTLINLIAKYI